jgi:hypothetical protein
MPRIWSPSEALGELAGVAGAVESGFGGTGAGGVTFAEVADGLPAGVVDTGALPGVDGNLAGGTGGVVGVFTAGTTGVVGVGATGIVLTAAPDVGISL